MTPLISNKQKKSLTTSKLIKKDIKERNSIIHAEISRNPLNFWGKYELKSYEY